MAQALALPGPDGPPPWVLNRAESGARNFVFQPRLVIGAIVDDGIDVATVVDRLRDVQMPESSVQLCVEAGWDELVTSMASAQPPFVNFQDLGGGDNGKKRLDFLHDIADRQKKAWTPQDQVPINNKYGTTKRHGVAGGNVYTLDETDWNSTEPWLQSLLLHAGGSTIATDLTLVLVFSRDDAIRIFRSSTGFNKQGNSDEPKVNIGIIAFNYPYKRKGALVSKLRAPHHRYLQDLTAIANNIASVAEDRRDSATASPISSDAESDMDEPEVSDDSLSDANNVNPIPRRSVAAKTPRQLNPAQIAEIAGAGNGSELPNSEQIRQPSATSNLRRNEDNMMARSSVESERTDIFGLSGVSPRNPLKRKSAEVTSEEREDEDSSFKQRATFAFAPNTNNNGFGMGVNKYKRTNASSSALSEESLDPGFGGNRRMMNSQRQHTNIHEEQETRSTSMMPPPSYHSSIAADRPVMQRAPQEGLGSPRFPPEGFRSRADDAGKFNQSPTSRAIDTTQPQRPPVRKSQKSSVRPSDARGADLSNLQPPPCQSQEIRERPETSLSRDPPKVQPFRLPRLPLGESRAMRSEAINYAEYMDSDLINNGNARARAENYADFLRRRMEEKDLDEYRSKYRRDADQRRPPGF